ncbi:MAG TPA: hypothetical protein HA353_06990 [Candidatus Poseidonia sp.]|nr:hypothetical protein [Poseidonia sp.]
MLFCDVRPSYLVPVSAIHGFNGRAERLNRRYVFASGGRVHHGLNHEQDNGDQKPDAQTLIAAKDASGNDRDERRQAQPLRTLRRFQACLVEDVLLRSIALD